MSLKLHRAIGPHWLWPHTLPPGFLATFCCICPSSAPEMRRRTFDIFKSESQAKTNISIEGSIHMSHNSALYLSRYSIWMDFLSIFRKAGS